MSPTIAQLGPYIVKETLKGNETVDDAIARLNSLDGGCPVFLSGSARPVFNFLSALNKITERSLIHHAEVVYAEPDYQMHAIGQPNDPFWTISNYMWGFRNINATKAWDITTGGPVKVCVIDTGAPVLLRLSSWMVVDHSSSAVAHRLGTILCT
jgi:hypothetical protein